MKITITENYDEMSKVVAEMVAAVVRSNPRAVLGLATGSTPIGVYKLLADFFRKKELSFKNVRTVNLDEYVGLGRQDEQSYISFMHNNLFDKVDLPDENADIPNGLADDLSAECRRYSGVISRCAQDLQILGLGSNGHIGFNEPNTPFDSVTHIVNLSEGTIRDNSRFFEELSQVPKQAITMGISEIMRAKKIVILASGRNKAEAVKRMVEGSVTEQCPASVLQTHPDCTVVVDKLAASLLSRI